MSFKVKDHFYKKAKKEHFLARSIYKLEEVDKKFKIINKGDQILDLGYFPGSWVQYSLRAVGRGGAVVGVDIQPVNDALSSSHNLKLLEQDAFEINGPEDLGCNNYFDVVLSDMAPKTTGMKDVDQMRSLNLVEKVFSILPKTLKPGGNVVVKVFESQQAQDFFKSLRKQFDTINYLRPKSTRSTSKEYFVIAKGYKA